MGALGRGAGTAPRVAGAGKSPPAISEPQQTHQVCKTKRQNGSEGGGVGGRAGTRCLIPPPVRAGPLTPAAGSHLNHKWASLVDPLWWMVLPTRPDAPWQTHGCPRRNVSPQGLPHASEKVHVSASVPHGRRDAKSEVRRSNMGEARRKTMKGNKIKKPNREMFSQRRNQEK